MKTIKMEYTEYKALVDRLKEKELMLKKSAEGGIIISQTDYIDGITFTIHSKDEILKKLTDRIEQLLVKKGESSEKHKTEISKIEKTFHNELKKAKEYTDSLEHYKYELPRIERELGLINPNVHYDLGAMVFSDNVHSVIRKIQELKDENKRLKSSFFYRLFHRSES